MKYCPVCSKVLRKWQHKYCSNLCQSKANYQFYIAKWKTGKLSGIRGISTKNISGHVQRYLREKYGEKCSLCGWSQKNPYTQRVPLEIDHVNGNSEDNSEDNLRMICPNCHSLSANFRNLNKGHGRLWRMKKYLKNHRSS